MKPEESSQSLVAEGKRRSVITWQGHVISSLQCVFDIYILFVSDRMIGFIGIHLCPV